jgi:hypothetical protein
MTLKRIRGWVRDFGFGTTVDSKMDDSGLRQTDTTVMEGPVTTNYRIAKRFGLRRQRSPYQMGSDDEG